MQDNIFLTYREGILAVIRGILPHLPDKLADKVELSPPRDVSHGDMATNAAMVISHYAKKPVKMIADELVKALQKKKGILSANIAGPGFVNIKLDPSEFQAVLPCILRQGLDYGNTTIGRGIPINIEYVSANPTGPLHVGHCRGAVVGDSLANLLVKAGFSVTKEYYINDSGAQVDALAWAAYWRYLQSAGTCLTEDDYDAKAPHGLQYRGDYLIQLGQDLYRKHHFALTTADRGVADIAVWFEIVKRDALEAMMNSIHEDLALLGVKHDVFTSEASIINYGLPDKAIEIFRKSGLIYEGVLRPPKGKKPDDWELRPQLLFRSTAFGDDVDRPLQKSDGSNTYFANDVGYHADKIARGAKILIDILGADHGGYIQRMSAAVKALSISDPVQFAAVICQIVKVVRNGQPIKMSKRAGNFVTLRDLLNEVGKDAVRFTMLSRKPDAQMDFDLDEVVAQTRDNPLFYVQYAHARCRSVLRMAQNDSIHHYDLGKKLVDADVSLLGSEDELKLIRKLAVWPRLVEQAALAWEPHRITFYLIELASDFHALWNKGREHTSLRFIQDGDLCGTEARLALVHATALVLQSGFKILGIDPVEEMR